MAYNMNFVDLTSNVNQMHNNKTTGPFYGVKIKPRQSDMASIMSDKQMN